LQDIYTIITQVFCVITIYNFLSKSRYIRNHECCGLFCLWKRRCCVDLLFLV